MRQAHSRNSAAHSIPEDGTDSFFLPYFSYLHPIMDLYTGIDFTCLSSARPLGTLRYPRAKPASPYVVHGKEMQEESAGDELTCGHLQGLVAELCAVWGDLCPESYRQNGHPQRA